MIIKHLSQISPCSHLHIVIGSFDGIHQGHKHIITQMMSKVKQDNEQSIIFSFEPLPKEFFLENKFQGRLVPADIKHNILKEFNTDHVIITDFEKIKDLSEKEFIELFLTKAEHITLYCGNDFRMGCINGEKYNGSKVTIIRESEFLINQKTCRSSIIRELLYNGDIETTNQLLGREYNLYSYVIPGDQIGRTLNFPTVNIKVLNQVIPKNGVYFGELFIYDQLFPTAIYMGNRPTINGHDFRIECHVIYEFPYSFIPEGTKAEVCFIKKIAEEKKFKSLENLKEILYNYKIISLELASKRYKNKN